jgi:hypothetical protein
MHTQTRGSLETLMEEEDSKSGGLQFNDNNTVLVDWAKIRHAADDMRRSELHNNLHLCTRVES